MILGVVSYKFINNDIKFNINQIEKAIEQSKNVDMLCFGETFLDLNENLMKKKDGLYYKLFMTQAKNYSN